MGCKHELIGTSEGVHCKLCGIRMTAEEYRAFLAGEYPRQEAQGEPSEAPKKRGRKPKEV